MDFATENFKDNAIINMQTTSHGNSTGGIL